MNAAEQLIAEGERRGLERGRAETLRETLASVLSSRGVPLSELGHARIVACSDVDTLSRWFQRALHARAEHEVFAEGGEP